MKKRVLILYATYGSGHKAIANYIKNYFLSKDTELEIKTIDLIDYCSNRRGIVAKKISENLMLHFPIIWNIIYKTSNHKHSSDISNRIIMKPFKTKRLENDIREFNPNLTIATHFYGSSIIKEYNKKKITNSKLITIVTDYEAHEVWLNDIDAIDSLVVCSKEEQRMLINKGIDKQKVKPYGIPIYPNKNEDSNKEKFIKELGLNPDLLTCVCFAGGGNGSTGTLPYLKAIMKQKKNINLIVICGRNEKAYSKAKIYSKKYNLKNIIVYGFVNNVPELLEHCDFVITKPGGAQTTECMYFKKPMLLIKSSGGQENSNIKYFTWKGFARRFRNPIKLARYYKKLDVNNRDLIRMQRNLNKNDSTKSMKKIYELSRSLMSR